jgi:thiaminase/transcriptional activator TenA
MGETVLHQVLWQANADLATECLAHPFVTGIRDGTLSAAAFRRYVAQDSFYLKVFFRAYALAAGKVERVEHMQLLHELLGGTIDEMRMHAGFARSLDIDLDHVEPLPPTRAYVDFLLDLAWNGGIDVNIAGMTPCMRLYAYLGGELGQTVTPAPDHPYGDWIRTYADPAFQSLADRVDAFLDEIATDTPAVRDVYRRAMHLERDFFEAALRG